MNTSSKILLSKEQLESQISQVDLLLGMYPGDDEVNIDAATRRWFDSLKEWCTSDAADDDGEVANSPAVLSFEIALNIDAPANVQKPPAIHLSVDVPTRMSNGLSADGDVSVSPPLLKARLRQPVWMHRNQSSRINASILPEYEDDLFATIEYLRDEATKSYATSTATNNNNNNSAIDTIPTSTVTHGTSQETQTDALSRVWFYFPSLSTRSKRNDLVNYAPHYSLTGFVLAGKPGILCLEGVSKQIDEYMKFIKTESWGDIPSYQKKVSERFRELDVKRVFLDMQEITDKEWMGEKRGERGNRGDLRALEAWLEGLGLGEGFGRVVMN